MDDPIKDNEDYSKSLRSEEERSKRARPDPFRLMLTRPVMLIGVMLTYLGMAMAFFAGREESLSTLFATFVTPRYLGIFLAIIGFTLFFFEFTKRLRSIRSKSFSDIDEERKAKGKFYGGGESEDLISELRSLRYSAGIDYGKIEEIIKKTQPKDERPVRPHGGFDEYFNAVITNLSARAQDSDEKASLLLERGISYVKFGLWFYFLAIVAWQTMIHFWGFKTEYAYGIATTSLLFLFIEFLSAWFLKQYRHFVDTATYLLKVKAIFDRYYLIYLALKGGEPHLSGDAKKLETLTSALTEDIKWPSDSHLTKADVAFAREALDSVSDLLKALKSSRKEKKDKESE